jgi:hypothetical protein
MVGTARQQVGVACMRRTHGFGGGGNCDNAPVLRSQSIASTKDMAPREYHTHLLASIEPRAKPAAAAHIERQHQQRIRSANFRAAVRAALPYHDDRTAQNKKYRCASGSTRAGSQVSNWPSARTS